MIRRRLDERPRAKQRALSTLGLILVALGCDDAMMDRSLLEGPRVLGAKAEVEGDPSRAWVNPGDDVRVSWLVAEPESNSEVSWSFTVCEAESTVRGLPYCADEPFVTISSEGVQAGAPSFSFTVPEAESLLGNEDLLVAGGFCFGSEIRARGPGDDPESLDCESGGELARATLHVGIIQGERGNANPSIEEAELRFAGEPWEPWPLEADPSAGCNQAPIELPRVAAGSTNHVIEATIPEKDRETLERDSSRAPAHEVYQLSHVVSAGELERPFSVIDDDAPDPRIELLWDAPKGASAGGSIVRFFFVARDLRGGADFGVRAVCVEPE